MIGVFDSGIGGLTVLRELLTLFPAESFLYLGDTARLPYGSKSPETIRKYSEQVMNSLADHKVKAIVIACNSASSQVFEKEWRGIPVLTVIEPGAKKAIELSESKKVGVLGTRATIQSQAYALALQKLDPAVQVEAQACPLFVPLAEEGWTDDPITNLITYRYVQPLLQTGIDTLILGCTHYPLLSNSIARVAGLGVQLIDPGLAVAEELQRQIESNKIEGSKSTERSLQILSTDLSPTMTLWATQILSPHLIQSFEHVDL